MHYHFVLCIDHKYGKISNIYGSKPTCSDVSFGGLNNDQPRLGVQIPLKQKFSGHAMSCIGLPSIIYCANCEPISSLRSTVDDLLLLSNSCANCEPISSLRSTVDDLLLDDLSTVYSMTSEEPRRPISVNMFQS